MPLDRQVISLPFGQALDTKSDPKQIPLGRFLTLENGVVRKTGRIDKCYGFQLRGASSNGEGGTFLAELNGRGVLGGYTGISTDFNGTWQETLLGGKYEALSLGLQSLKRDAIEKVYCDWIQDPNGAFSVVTWVNATNIYGFQVFASTGQVSYVGTTAGPARLFTVNGLVYACWIYSNNLYMAKIDVTGMPLGTSTITATGANNFLDVVTIGTKAYIAYRDGSGHLSIMAVTSGGISGSPVTVTSATTHCASIFGAGSAVWIAWDDSATRFKVASYDTSLNLILAATNVSPALTIQAASSAVAGFVKDNGDVWVLYDTVDSFSGASSEKSFTIHGALVSGGSVSIDAFVKRSCALMSRPFALNSRSLVLGIESEYGQDSGQRTAFLFDIATGDVLSKSLAGVAHRSLTSYWVPSVRFGTDLVNIPVLQGYRVEASRVGTGLPALLHGASLLQFEAKQPQQAIEISGNLLITGAQLWNYDGNSVTEHGFHLYPQYLSVSSSASGGAVDDGTRNYLAVYEWQDAAGQIHFSGYAGGVSITTAGGNTSTVTVKVACLHVTNKQNVQVGIYRTLINGGTTYHRLGSVANDPNQLIVTYSDTASETTAEAGLVLYNGVENTAPPAPRALAFYKNRVILIPWEDSQVWWFSKEIIHGSYVTGAPIEFSDLQVKTMDLRGGDLVAAHQLDDKLIFFKERAGVFIVTGNGPAQDGVTGDDYQPPTFVSVDCGSIDPRSVVQTPQGLMFKSTKGIMLLDRGLNPSYIGAPVEDYNSASVLGAVRLEDGQFVYFGLSSGVILCWDYFHQQWSVFTGHPVSSMALLGGKPAYVTAFGFVYSETTAGYGESFHLKTGWLSFAQVQGYQRVRRLMFLGTWKTTHAMRIKVRHNFVEDVTQDVQIVPAATSSLPYQYRLHLQTQKSQAVQFEFTETQYGWTEGLSLSSFALEVGVKRGLYKAPSAWSAG
jgi:hypothetical protein